MITFLPVVSRELRVAARRASTYRARWGSALIAIIIAVFLSVFGRLAAAPSEAGRVLFFVLSISFLGFAVVEALRNTADCLSEEKREGTLGLLFLTPLKSYDVVLGKMAGTSLNSFYGLMAMLPVLALAFFVGGVTAGEFWRVVLVLIQALFSSLIVGMWVSARSWDEREAIFGTLGFLVLQWAFPPLLDAMLGMTVFSFLSPGFHFYSAFDAQFRGSPGNYWGSLLTIHLVGWLFLFLACGTLRRKWHEPAKSDWAWLRWLSVVKTRKDSREKTLLDQHPIQWIASRDIPSIKGFVFLALTSLAIPLVILSLLKGKGPDEEMLVFGFVFVVSLGLKVWTALQASRFFAEAKRTGFLEQLLSTPIQPGTIVRGHYLALRTFFGQALAVLAGAEFLALYVHTLIVPQGPGIAASVFTAIFLLIYNALLMLDLVAISWLGMWMGLSQKKVSAAAIKTIVYITIIPWFTFIVPPCGIIFGLLWPIFWISWAQGKLRKEFRHRIIPAYKI